MSVPDLDFRPCGACNELVPTDTGCSHWRPGIKRAAARPGRVKGRAAVPYEDTVPPLTSRGTPRQRSLPPRADSPEVTRRMEAVLREGGLTARQGMG